MAFRPEPCIKSFGSSVPNYVKKRPSNHLLFILSTAQTYNHILQNKANLQALTLRQNKTLDKATARATAIGFSDGKREAGQQD